MTQAIAYDVHTSGRGEWQFARVKVVVPTQVGTHVATSEAGVCRILGTGFRRCDGGGKGAPPKIAEGAGTRCV